MTCFLGRRVIASGTVAEEGTHESLAEAGGLYSALVSFFSSTKQSRYLCLMACPLMNIEDLSSASIGLQIGGSQLIAVYESVSGKRFFDPQEVYIPVFQVRRQFSKTASSASLATTVHGSSYTSLPALNPVAPAAGASPL